MLTRYLDPDWKVAHRLWSIRIALFWAAFCGLYAVIPAFQGYVSPFALAMISMGMGVLICIARLANQPGVP